MTSNNTVVSMDTQLLLDKIRRMGIKLEEKRAELKELIEEVETLKNNISDAMELVNLDEFTIPLGEEEVVIKQNRRTINKFDKEALAKRAGSSVSELNYTGVARLVEDGVVSANDVDVAYKEHTYTFITAKRRALDPNRKNK